MTEEEFTARLLKVLAPGRGYGKYNWADPQKWTVRARRLYLRFELGMSPSLMAREEGRSTGAVIGSVHSAMARLAFQARHQYVPNDAFDFCPALRRAIAQHNREVDELRAHFPLDDDDELD